MHLEQPDVLRTWLTNTLEPVCDADPAALAKYVMALLKKDKTVSELKDFCLDQLDVFLQKETTSFVDKLFDAIESKSYMQTNKSHTSTDPDILTQEIKKEIKQEKGVQPSTSQESTQSTRKVVRKKISAPEKDVKGEKDAEKEKEKEKIEKQPTREVVRKEHSRSRSRSRERREKERAARRAARAGDKFVMQRDRDREGREGRAEGREGREKRRRSNEDKSRSPKDDKRRKRERGPPAKVKGNIDRFLQPTPLVWVQNDAVLPY